MATEWQAWADRVLAAAQQATKFHGDRAYIASVLDVLGIRGRAEREQAKAALVSAHRRGLLRLTRADMVSAMPPDLVRGSETRYLDATWHFVALD